MVARASFFNPLIFNLVSFNRDECLCKWQHFLLAHFQLHDMNKRNRKYAFHEDDKFDLKNDDFVQT